MHRTIALAFGLAALAAAPAWSQAPQRRRSRRPRSKAPTTLYLPQRQPPVDFVVTRKA